MNREITTLNRVAHVLHSN